MDCIFCKIINNEIPSYKVYEDDLVLAFLDITPSTNGDILLIPKKHVITFDELDEETILHLHKVTKLINKKLKTNLNAKGLTISTNNGLGQEIKHFHLHLTPRYDNDLLDHIYNKDVLLDLDTIIKKLNDNQ